MEQIKVYLIKDLSLAYEWIQKMLQYNFNEWNFKAITEWIHSTWQLIQIKRDEWMKEKDLYSKFETERNRVEKEIDKELKDKTDPEYLNKKNEELNKRMQAVIDPYMNEFIETTTVDENEYKVLKYKFQETVPAYVNMYMLQNACVEFTY